LIQHIHITCENFEDSIKENGLLNNPPYKIGDDYEDTDNNEYDISQTDEYIPGVEIFDDDLQYENYPEEYTSYGGKNKLRKNKTRKNKKNNNRTKGWKQQKPGYYQRTIMLKKCGKKCFLGSKKRFPICKKNTCKISRQGVQSAYIRARQFGHSAISKKAKTLLRKLKKE
jgi:hypothetical protein